MPYSYQTVYSDPQVLASRGYAKVSHIPCIFDSRPGYHRLGSEFLIDRALGLWDPKGRGTATVPIPPSTKSNKNYADRLCNFLEWCEVNELNPLEVEYNSDIIGKYQQDMMLGAWSRDNRPLSERTINVRVDISVEYLNWCSDKGYREQLVVPKITRTFAPDSYKEFGGKEHKVEGRVGKLRENAKRLTFPPERELAAWRTRVAKRAARGATEILIVDLILETAIRREEAACWRIDTLPLSRSEWKVVNPDANASEQIVLVEIRYGAKGREYGRDHGDKIGPVGTIRIPMLIANRLASYRDKFRIEALKLAVKNGRNLKQQRRIKEESVHLFLSPLTGLRYSGNQIYEFWRHAAPPKGWSPHRARDFWSCNILWMRLEQFRELSKIALGSCSENDVVAALKNNVLSVIQLEIQPQLRHRSHETTVLYLLWVADRLSINLNLHERWADDF
jgi:hypothetical protein